MGGGETGGWGIREANGEVGGAPIEEVLGTMVGECDIMDSGLLFLKSSILGGLAKLDSLCCW
jgi:hypothetical protein